MYQNYGDIISNVVRLVEQLSKEREIPRLFKEFLFLIAADKGFVNI